MTYQIPIAYVGGTAGARDGSPLAATDNLGATYAGTSDAIGTLGAVNIIGYRCPLGKRTPSAMVLAPTLDKTGTLDATRSICGTSGGTYVASALNIGVVTDVHTLVYQKQATGKTPTNGWVDPTTDPIRNCYMQRSWGGDLIDMPVISSVSHNTASTSITSTWTPNATCTSVKEIVQLAASAAPDEAAWTAATVRASGYQATGLTPSTDYKVYLRSYDADGYGKTLLAEVYVSGTLTTPATQAVVSFSSQPAASAVTSQGFTVTYNISNPYATHKISIDSGAFSTFAPTGTGPFTYAVAGLATGSHTVVIRNTDGTTTVDSSTLTQSVAAPANVSSITPTAGYNSVALPYAAVSGAATYRIRRATNLSGGQLWANIVVLAAANAGTTYTDSTAAYNTLYYYDIIATDSAGNVSVTPLVSAAVTTLALGVPSLSVVGGNAKVTATIGTVANATGYDIAYGTSDPGSGATASASSVTSPYDVTGLTDTTLEHVRVRAHDGAGNNSAWSADVTATPGVVRTNPVLWLDANKANSTVSGPHSNADADKTTWFDRSGNARNFTVNNAAFTTASGWRGNGSTADPYAFIADGVDDYLSRASDAGLSMSIPFSLEFWVKHEKDISAYAAGNVPMLVDKIAFTPTTRNYALYWGRDADAIDVHRVAGILQTSMISSVPPAPNGYIQPAGGSPVTAASGWHHIVAVTSGAIGNITITVYVDGVARTTWSTINGGDVTTWPDTNSFSGYTNASAVNLLGRSDALAVTAANVRCGVVRFYSAALSSADVTSNFNAERARFGL